MARRQIIGRIAESKMRFEWEIQDFISTVEDPFHSRFVSHDFEFACVFWQLELIPHYGIPNEEWIEIGLYRDMDRTAQQVRVSIGILKPCGTETVACNTSINIPAEKKCWGVVRLLKKCELRPYRDELMEDDTLTIFCCMGKEKSGGEEERSRGEEEERMLNEKSCDLLCQHLGELMATLEDSDITFRVSGQDFRAHSFILRARSPVFNCMLSHNMVEKNSGVITVDDFEPTAFGQFLNFVYTGSVEALSMDTAVSLFCAADKYDFQPLKDRCREFLQGNLSTSAVCDVLRIAALHKEKKLISRATQFFADHLDEILVRESWMEFLNEDPDVANMVFRDSIRLILQKKKTT